VTLENLKLTSREKALLEILIHEIQGALVGGKRQVKRLLITWIEANDLHPENVQTMTIKAFLEYLEKEG